MSVVVAGAIATFTTSSGTQARGRIEITTAAPTVQVSLRFTTTRRPMMMRAGTTVGGQELFADITLSPGEHLISFIPGVSPYYIEFGLVEEGVATVENLVRVAPGLMSLPTPWLTDELRGIRYEQSADVMWLYHPLHQTRVLERRGNNSWSLRQFQPTDGPFEQYSTSGATLTPSARTGVVTIAANRAVFRSQDVGALVRLNHAGQFASGLFDQAGDVTDSVLVSGVGTTRALTVSLTGTFSGTVVLQRSIGSDTAWADFESYTTPTTKSVSDGLDNQLVYYRLRMSAYTSGSASGSLFYARGETEGVARIVTVTADNEVTADVLRPFSATTGTGLWSFGAWSSRSGWPAAGTIHDGRHWIGRDDRLWGSASDDYESFLIGVLDSDAIGRRVSTGQINATRWVEGVGRLVVGTASAEVEARSTTFEEPITPTNMSIRSRSTRGSANAQAMKLDDDLLFINRTRERLYRLTYSDERESYISFDLTRLNRDIGRDAALVELAVQIDREPRVWVPRADGKIAVLLFEPNEQVFGWTRLDYGFCESVCVLPGRPEDSVYLVFARTIGGSTVRYVEKLASEWWTDVEEAWRVASGVRVASETAFSAVSGLAHLEGQQVYAWADGAAQGPFTVTGGAITLARPANVAIVGLNYVAEYISAKLAYGAQGGSALTQDRQVNRLGLLLYRTAGGCVAWGDAAESALGLQRLEETVLMPELALDAPVSVRTEDIAAPLPGATSRDPRIRIVMDLPGPAEVLGLVPSVDTKERA